MPSAYTQGLEVLSGAGSSSVSTGSKNDERWNALYGILSLAGGIFGAKLWPKHWIIAFLLGSSLGSRMAVLLTGHDPFEVR